jgi:1-acyl-sn-glycerol-3-phosphate acyltransferase
MASPRSAAPITRPGPVFFIGRAILRPLLRLRYRPRIVGRENIPVTGPVLLASNHLSSLDTIIIPSFASRQVQFLAKSSLFESRLGGWFMRQIGAIPVMREAGSGAQAALDAGREVLAAGRVFAVFPEGSRSRDGRLHRGRGGAAFMALEAGAQVVPVGLIGTNRELRDPATGRAPRVEVRFGRPVPLDDLAHLPGGRARREATERIMSAIGELTGQEPADGYAEGGRGA